MENKGLLTIGIILTSLAIIGILLPWTNKTEFISIRMQEFSTLMWIGYIICITAGISYILALIWNKDSFLELNCEIAIGGWFFLMFVGYIGTLISSGESSKLSVASWHFRELRWSEMITGNPVLETIYSLIYASFSRLELKYSSSSIWIYIHFFLATLGEPSLYYTIYKNKRKRFKAQKKVNIQTKLSR